MVQVACPIAHGQLGRRDRQTVRTRQLGHECRKDLNRLLEITNDKLLQQMLHAERLPGLAAGLIATQQPLQGLQLLGQPLDRRGSVSRWQLHRQGAGLNHRPGRLSLLTQGLRVSVSGVNLLRCFHSMCRMRDKDRFPPQSPAALVGVPNAARFQRHLVRAIVVFREVETEFMPVPIVRPVRRVQRNHPYQATINPQMELATSRVRFVPCVRVDGDCGCKLSACS